jgi:hypothetical protein
VDGSIGRGRSARRRAAAVIHLHLHIIGVERTLRWVVSMAGLTGWIWNDGSVVGAGAGVPNDYMALFEVLYERM